MRSTKSSLLVALALLSASAAGQEPPVGAARSLTLGTVLLERCELGGAGLGEALPARCATLQVAADPAVPQGKQLDLRIAVLPARDAQALPDPLLFIAGGPGQSALDSYPQIAAALQRINQSRHVVLVDQRGTGQSSPLSCKAAMAAAAGVDDADASVDPARLRAQAAACAAELQSDPRLYTTTAAVADLEQVRQRLGFEQFNVYGVSYGTRVAQVYARKHPQALRSLILDGVVPPDLALGGEFGQRLDQALARIFAGCSTDPRCRERFGDPGATLRQLHARLREAPVTVQVPDPRSAEPLTRRVTADRLAALVRMYAYAPETQALLPVTLAAAADGNFGPLLGQSLFLEEQLEDALNQGMQLSVLCSEDIDLLAAEPSAAERDSLLGGSLGAALRAQCEAWPRGTRPADFHAPLVSAVPALLLSGELDPVTPPEYGERALAGFSKGRHLVARGQGHNVLPRGCLPKLAEQFIEGLDPAALDAKCLDQLVAAPFFLNFNGSAP